jgi:hypothetical protein
MLIVVVGLNVILALFCFYVAWRTWQLRQALSSAADALIAAEESTHNVLHNAPEAILNGQIGTRQLRQSYRQLEPKFQQVRQALLLISVGNTVLRKRSRLLPLTKLSRKRKSR